MAKNTEPDRFAAMRRFARHIQNGAREPDPFLCRHLRTRTWYVPDASAEREGPRPPGTTQYWCLRTMRADGPDGALALAQDCTDERSCFEAAVVPMKGDS